MITLSPLALLFIVLVAFIIGVACGVKWANPSRYAGGKYL